MRLCRFDNNNYGIVLGDRVHDITAIVRRVVGHPADDERGDPVIARLDALKKALHDVSSLPSRPLAQVRLLSPIAHPSKLVAAPVNYRAHIAEMAKQSHGGATGPARSKDIGEAGLFLKANSALVGPSEGVAIRFPNRRNDHEVELAVVIGRRGSDIPMERAYDYVAGYALGLDMTVRGPEDRSFRKSIDGYAVLGPWMVTADEIANPESLSFSLTLNGEPRQNANTADMIYSIPRLIAFASSFYTLWPGDVIYTGSPEGVSPVKPGDLMVAESPAIGRMEVRVRQHQPG